MAHGSHIIREIYYGDSIRLVLQECELWTWSEILIGLLIINYYSNLGNSSVTAKRFDWICPTRRHMGRWKWMSSIDSNCFSCHIHSDSRGKHVECLFLQWTLILNWDKSDDWILRRDFDIWILNPNIWRMVACLTI